MAVALTILRGVLFWLAIVIVLLALLSRTRPFQVRLGPALRTPPRKASSTCRWSNYSNFPDYSSFEQESGAPETRKLFYSKVPKTGSSTVSSLLFQFAKDHKLVVFKPVGTSIVTGPGMIRETMREESVQRIDAILHHARYTEALVDEFLSFTREDGTPGRPFRVASVRHPRDRLVSTFFFGHDRVALGFEPSFACPNVLHDYEKWVAECRPTSQHMYMSPADWSMTRRENISEIVSHYDHVFVTERMITSILALAPKLRLTLREMLAVPRKTSYEKSGAASVLAARHGTVQLGE